MGAALDQGEIVLARYRLEEKLGEGGMGVVWAASHLVTRKRVALKILKVKTDENVWRFFREARIAGEIRHPNLVDVSDLLRLEDGTPVMVMELLRGESLGAAIATGKRLDHCRMANILAVVADTLADVHERGIIHRDLKPENIFVEDNGTVKILDFGVAKLSQEQVTETIGGMTQTGALVGTPAYMAPEQVFGEKDVDSRADAWSLGAIMFEVFSGRRLVQADNFGQAFKAITMGAIPRLGEVAPNCPRAIARLVDSFLARERDERFVDLRAAAVRLRNFANGVPDDVEDPPAESSRVPKRAAMVAGALLGLVATAAAVAVVRANESSHAIALEHATPIAFEMISRSREATTRAADSGSAPGVGRTETPKALVQPTNPPPPKSAGAKLPTSVSAAPASTPEPKHGGISAQSPYSRPQ